jgi:DNA-binding LacI/PurR family transcriptional regulator
MASTVKDVARLAGVSTATVSRVANGAGNVSDESRTRVLTAISRLQYCPNPHASELGRARGGGPRNCSFHVLAPVSKGAKLPSYSEGDAQKAHRQRERLRFLEAEYKRMRRVVAELSKRLEKLRNTNR